MKFKKIQGLSFKYFLSIAGKARLSLAKFLISFFSIVYFCVRLSFLFDAPFIVYIIYTVLVYFIFIFTYFLSEDKFERILKNYLDFFYNRFYLFDKLVNLFLEFYLGFFKVPLYGASCVYFVYMCLSIGSQEFALGVLCLYGFIGFFTFTLFGLFVHAIDYMNVSGDKWSQKSEIMNELTTIEPVFLSIESYYPLRFHNNEIMQNKILLFVNNVMDKTNNYYQRRNMRIFTQDFSQIRNFIVVNGKMVATGSVAAGMLGTGAFLFNEERKRAHDAQQRDKDRKHDGEQRDKDRKHDGEQRDKDRELHKNEGGFLSGLFGRSKGSGPKSSVIFDFYDFMVEFFSSLYLIIFGNSFFFLRLLIFY